MHLNKKFLLLLGAIGIYGESVNENVNENENEEISSEDKFTQLLMTTTEAPKILPTSSTKTIPDKNAYPSSTDIPT